MGPDPGFSGSLKGKHSLQRAPGGTGSCCISEFVLTEDVEQSLRVPAQG